MTTTHVPQRGVFPQKKVPVQIQEPLGVGSKVVYALLIIVGIYFSVVGALIVYEKDYVGVLVFLFGALLVGVPSYLLEKDRRLRHELAGK